jgi:hypothetical protein
MKAQYGGRSSKDPVDVFLDTLGATAQDVRGHGFCWASSFLWSLNPLLQPHAQQGQELMEFCPAEISLEHHYRAWLKHMLQSVHPELKQFMGKAYETKDLKSFTPRSWHLFKTLHKPESRRGDGGWGDGTFLLYQAM